MAALSARMAGPPSLARRSMTNACSAMRCSVLTSALPSSPTNPFFRKHRCRPSAALGSDARRDTKKVERRASLSDFGAGDAPTAEAPRRGQDTAAEGSHSEADSEGLQEASLGVTSELTELVVSAALGLAFPLAAFAADVDAGEVAASAPAWLGQALLLLPVVAYGGFFWLRAKLNPKAGVLDFLFVLTAVVIIANIFTSIFLKVRLY